MGRSWGSAWRSWRRRRRLGSGGGGGSFPVGGNNTSQHEENESFSDSRETVSTCALLADHFGGDGDLESQSLKWLEQVFRDGIGFSGEGASLWVGYGLRVPF